MDPKELVPGKEYFRTDLSLYGDHANHRYKYVGPMDLGFVFSSPAHGLFSRSEKTLALLREYVPKKRRWIVGDVAYESEKKARAAASSLGESAEVVLYEEVR